MALLEADQGGDVNEVHPRGITILYQAVLDREIGAIEALLRHGADPNLGYVETHASARGRHDSAKVCRGPHTRYFARD